MKTKEYSGNMKALFWHIASLVALGGILYYLVLIEGNTSDIAEYLRNAEIELQFEQ